MKTIRQDGAIRLDLTAAGPAATAHFTLPDGKTVALLFLGQKNAEEAWKIRSGDDTRLLVTEQQAFIDGDTATLEDLGVKKFTAMLIPEDSARLVSPEPGARIVLAAMVLSNPSSSASAGQLLNAKQTHSADAPAPLPADFKPSTRPRSVAAAPTEADWSRAATYSIPIPTSALADSPATQHFLRITYTGNVARISANGHLLDDNFADGRPWLVGLTRFLPQLQKDSTLLLSIYPLRPDPPIFFEPGDEPKPGASLESVELLTQYTLKLKLETPPVKKP